uniref:G-protein coupled receptors family 1 profile domain-containing protein n=1 Tax=Panagrolaimus sp. ES5 TaxID=591445 RepID=A0AC34FQV2_9BILA
MVRRLFLRSRSIPTSQLPVNRIAGYTIAISVFFVLCWSPYWVAMLYNLYRTFYTIDLEQHTSEKFIYVMYGIHALPYVNSASNWLLYGLLNSQLMRRAHANKCNGQRSFGREESRILPTFVVAANVKTPLTAATNIKEETKEDSSIILPRNSDSLL